MCGRTPSSPFPVVYIIFKPVTTGEPLTEPCSEPRRIRGEGSAQQTSVLNMGVPESRKWQVLSVSLPEDMSIKSGGAGILNVRVHKFCLGAPKPQPFPSVSRMSAFNSAGMNFGYPTSKGNNFDFYSFGSMQSLDFGNTYHFEPDAAITEQDTYGLNPSTEEYIDQFGYQECTFLNVSEGQFVSPHTLHMVSPYETGEVAANRDSLS